MFMYSAQALHYAVLEEGEYPVEIMGAVTFIISPLGYSAESIMPLYNGWCLNHFSGLEGYEMIFKTFIGMLCIAIVAILIFRKLTKERRTEMAEMRKKGEEANQLHRTVKRMQKEVTDYDEQREIYKSCGRNEATRTYTDSDCR